MYRVQTMYLQPRGRAHGRARARARGGYWWGGSFLQARVVYICTLVKKIFLWYPGPPVKATIEEKHAAHVRAGFDPARETPLSTSEWVALKVWIQNNPSLRFRRGDYIAPGRYFYVYHRKCRAGMFACPLETIAAYREGQRESLRATPEERAARKQARKVRAIHNTLEHKAAERGLECSLSPGDIEDYIDVPCFYCGAKPAAGRSHGLDRLYNGNDYHYDNCVPSCWPCNHAKMTLEASEFLDLVARIARYQLKLQAQ